MSAASSMAGHTITSIQSSEHRISFSCMKGVQRGLIISISVGGGNLMIHHAMWIWTQAVLLCAAFDADSKSNERI